jgi:hypothetical protein
VVFLLQVPVETAQLLTLHHRQARVVSIQVSHLNFGRVQVLTTASSEGDAAPVNVFAFVRSHLALIARQLMACSDLP